MLMTFFLELIVKDKFLWIQFKPLINLQLITWVTQNYQPLMNFQNKKRHSYVTKTDQLKLYWKYDEINLKKLFVNFVNM